MDARLLELAIQSLPWAAFEDLVFSLVHVDEPRARQMHPPDAGRDTVVDASEGRRERAWQAKHHTSGINWSDCEKSLKRAVKERDPETVTFAFPVNFTEGKEAGLTNLRNRYRTVEIPEPWTLGTLRDKLAAHPDIRRQHIDRRFEIDEAFMREMLARGARLREGWDAQTVAAIEGPLAVAGQSDALQDAEQLAERGDSAGASTAYEAIAEALPAGMPAVADVLRLRAASAAREAGDNPRAAQLYLWVSRAGAERGDGGAEYAAFRASWLLGPDDRWRATAATARAAWPEEPEESIAVLLDAFERSARAEDLEGVEEWGVACCEALLASGRSAEARDVAARAGVLLGPVTEPGRRLALELDLLEARAEQGERSEVDAAFGRLLLTGLGRDPATAGLIRARWGCAGARAGDGPAAALRFRDASESWRHADDGEDELAEAVMSESVTGQLLGTGRVLEQMDRIAVAELRARASSPAVLADRKELEGLRAWLDGRAYDGRRSLIISWSVHRGAGHLAGCIRLAAALHELFTRAQEPAEALIWAIRAGKQLKARVAALQLGWAATQPRLSLYAAPWERGASFGAFAATAASADDEQIADALPALLQAAGDHDADERVAVNAPAAARRAIAAVLCAVDEADFPAALEEVVYETDHAVSAPRDRPGPGARRRRRTR